MGLAVAALGHVMQAPHTYHTRKSFHKLPTHTHQTVSISTTKHTYRYATLLLGVRVCLGGVRRNLRLACVLPLSVGVSLAGRSAWGSPPCCKLEESPVRSRWCISPPYSSGAR